MNFITLQDLVEKHPVLLTYSYYQGGSGEAKDLIQTLVDCGYLFAEAEVITRVRKCEHIELKDYLSFKLMKIQQCM